MKNNSLKIISLVGIFACLFCMLVFSACGSSRDNGSLELTDLSGRTVKLDKPASCIAALSASDCEVLCAIGAKDTIIARGTYCNYSEEIASIKDVGSGNLTSTEELAVMKPDIVLMSKTGFTLDQVNAMENAGLKTLVNEANTFDDTYKYIELLAKLTGHENEGAKLIANMQNSVNDFRNKTNGKEQKTVYFQLCLPQHGYWTAGKNTFMDEMCQILNCKNVFDDVQGWAEVSKEEIEARHPDVTIRIDDDESFTRPGPRLVDALEKMYKLIYE